MNYELDEYEQEILDSIERGEWIEAADSEEIIRRVKASAKAQFADKHLNIDLSAEDYRKLSDFARSKGIDTAFLAKQILHTFSHRI